MIFLRVRPLFWGCFKAMNLAEEFRKKKVVEHPKALSILALTSIEREGKSMVLLEQRIAKQIADAIKGYKIVKFDTLIQIRRLRISSKTSWPRILN